MVKLFRLTKNEIKKQFYQRTLWVMLIVLFAVSLISVAIFRIDDSFMNSDYDYGMTFEEYCETEIDFYKGCIAESPDALAEDIAYYETEIERYQLLLDSDADWGDWRETSDVAYLAIECKRAGDNESYEMLRDAVKQNSPNLFFRWIKEVYAADLSPKVGEIYVWAMDFCMANDVIPDEYSDWRFAAVATYIQNSETVIKQEFLQENGGAWSQSKLEEARNAAALARYRLENNVSANPADSFGDELSVAIMYETYTPTSSFWNAMAASSSLISLAGLFLIIMAGGIVANEFSAGTVKFLLLAPVKRWKILLSKYLTVLLLVPVLLILIFVFTFLPALSLGAADAFAPALFAQNGIVTQLSPYLLLLRDYGLGALQLILMFTLAFALSALLRSASVAVSVSLFANLVGSMVVSILQLMGFDWARYILFSNLDLAAIANGTSLFPHQSLPVAIVIVVAHMAVFLLTAHDAFTRREV